MADPLAHLHQQLESPWLIGGDSQQFIRQVEQRSQELKPFTEANLLPKILLIERDPVRFLAGFIAACSAECPVFLGNPDWVDSEWQQVWNVAQPNLVWGDRPASYANSQESSPPSGDPHDSGWIMIPTGGSSGQVRFAIHTWATLTASVQGFQNHFQLHQVNSCCVLPLYHVSGLMQFLRSFTSGGRLAVLPFKSLIAGTIPDFDPTNFFLSLVPTQLQRSLQHPKLVDWLRQFQTVLLGGAPAWADLLDQARQQGIRLAPTYGMTETASQIATLHPDQFLKGDNSVGHLLPHAQVTICNTATQPLSYNQVGKITIQANSLALGYYPDRFSQAIFQTDDLGQFDQQNRLHIVGRNSNKIITGGENVFPEEIEAAIRATQLVNDVCVLGLADPDWGEVVTAIYIPIHSAISSQILQAELRGKLSGFKQPKRWITVKDLPRNTQGKINRDLLKQQFKTVCLE